MPDEIEVEAEDTAEFDAAFQEKAEQSEANNQDQYPGEVGEENANEEEKDFDDAFNEAAADPAALEEPEVDLSAELEKTKAELEKLKQSERSQRGRVSALTKKLVEQRAANEPPKVQEENTGDADSDEDEDEDWEEFNREFPEMAAIVDKRLNSVKKKVEKVSGQVERVTTTQDTLVEDKILTYKAEQFEDLRDAHRDVDEIKVSPEFAKWRVNAPAEIQAKIKSHHAADATKVLDTFKEQTGWGKTPPANKGKSEVELINQRRKEALQRSAGISSKTVGRTAKNDALSDDFDDAFDAAARKKEKQRSRMYS